MMAIDILNIFFEDEEISQILPMLAKLENKSLNQVKKNFAPIFLRYYFQQNNPKASEPEIKNFMEKMLLELEKNNYS